MVIRKSLQNTMGIAPDTALMLQNTMLGQSVPATGLFTPPWDCIHTFFLTVHAVTIQASASVLSTPHSSK